MSAQLSREQLNWAKEVYKETAPDRAAAQERANRISDLQAQQMEQSTSIAQQQYDRYQRLYQPVEDRIVSEANNYDTADRQNAEAGKAVTDVQNQYVAALAAQDADLKSMGVNPNDGRYAAMKQQGTTAAALAQAQAANAARQNVQQQGWARRMDAAGLGRGVVSNQATQAGIASQAGAGALNASNSSLAAGQSGVGIMQQGFNGALQGQSVAGQMYGNIANQQASVSNANIGGLASAAGAAATAYGAYAGAVVI
ncbi:MAG: hypothetical protein ACN6O3_06360 [Comamonas sp.]